MKKILKYLILLAVLMIFFGSVSSADIDFASLISKLKNTVAEAVKSDPLRGKASYYADRYQGRMTSNGEAFDHDNMTAAHRELPFGTRVKVTNLENRRSVIVRINDRGPFKPGRVIDLTKTAAARLGMIEAGIAEVQLEIIE